jgi:hypothetical protein
MIVQTKPDWFFGTERVWMGEARRGWSREHPLPSRGHPMAFDLIMNGKYLVGAVLPLFLAKDESADDYSELHLDIEKRVGDGVSLAPG